MFKMITRPVACLLLFIGLVACATQQRVETDLNHDNDVMEIRQESGQGTIASINRKQWTHGSEDCRVNPGPDIDALVYDEDSIILRQNKCQHYEAPFLYLLFGSDTIILLDTGAVQSFPMLAIIEEFIKAHPRFGPGANYQLIVLHSHSHADHTAADSQFRNKVNVTLVEANKNSLDNYFKFSQSGNVQKSMDLGNRHITVMPVPGHQSESIALYDDKTGWLLTGDTFYPGVIYIEDWDAYRNSIGILAAFTQQRAVSGIMGAHIEMSRIPGKHYPIGSRFQPNESGLLLSVDDLMLLHNRLQSKPYPEPVMLPRLQVKPLNWMQRVLRWLFS